MTDTISIDEARRLQAEAMYERDLQEQVRQIALSVGAHFYHTWNSRKSAPGFPDCIILLGDRHIVAELKREGKEPTAAQRAWLQAFEDAGSEVYVWKPMDLIEGRIHEILEAIA